MQYKTYNFLISGIFHVTFSEYGRGQIIETRKRKTTGVVWVGLAGVERLGSYCEDFMGLVASGIRLYFILRSGLSALYTFALFSLASFELVRRLPHPSVLQGEKPLNTWLLSIVGVQTI